MVGAGVTVPPEAGVTPIEEEEEEEEEGPSPEEIASAVAGAIARTLLPPLLTIQHLLGFNLPTIRRETEQNLPGIYTETSATHAWTKATQYTIHSGIVPYMDPFKMMLFLAQRGIDSMMTTNPIMYTLWDLVTHTSVLTPYSQTLTGMSDINQTQWYINMEDWQRTLTSNSTNTVNTYAQNDVFSGLINGLFGQWDIKFPNLVYDGLWLFLNSLLPPEERIKEYQEKPWLLLGIGGE